MQQMREQDHRAGEFQDHRLLRGAFLSWRSTTVVRVEEKETKADGVRHMALLRHAMRAWKQVRWYHCVYCGISLLLEMQAGSQVYIMQAKLKYSRTVIKQCEMYHSVLIEQLTEE